MALCLRDHAGHFLSPLDTGSSARVPALSPRSEDAAGPSWAGAWPGRGSEGWAVPVLTGIWMEAGEVSGDGPGSWLEPGGELVSFSPSTLCPRPPQPVSSPVAGARLTHHSGPRPAPQRPELPASCLGLSVPPGPLAAVRAAAEADHAPHRLIWSLGPSRQQCWSPRLPGGPCMAPHPAGARGRRPPLAPGRCVLLHLQRASGWRVILLRDLFCVTCSFLECGSPSLSGVVRLDCKRVPGLPGAPELASPTGAPAPIPGRLTLLARPRRPPQRGLRRGPWVSGRTGGVGGAWRCLRGLGVSVGPGVVGGGPGGVGGGPGDFSGKAPAPWGGVHGTTTRVSTSAGSPGPCPQARAWIAPGQGEWGGRWRDPPPPKYKGLTPQRWSRAGTPWTRWAST